MNPFSQSPTAAGEREGDKKTDKAAATLSALGAARMSKAITEYDSQTEIYNASTRDDHSTRSNQTSWNFDGSSMNVSGTTVGESSQNMSYPSKKKKKKIEQKSRRSYSTDDDSGGVSISLSEDELYDYGRKKKQEDGQRMKQNNGRPSYLQRGSTFEEFLKGHDKSSPSPQPAIIAPFPDYEDNVDAYPLDATPTKDLPLKTHSSGGGIESPTLSAARAAAVAQRVARQKAWDTTSNSSHAPLPNRLQSSAGYAPAQLQPRLLTTAGFEQWHCGKTLTHLEEFYISQEDLAAFETPQDAQKFIQYFCHAIHSSIIQEVYTAHSSHDLFIELSRGERDYRVRVLSDEEWARDPMKRSNTTNALQTAFSRLCKLKRLPYNPLDRVNEHQYGQSYNFKTIQRIWMEADPTRGLRCHNAENTSERLHHLEKPGQDLKVLDRNTNKARGHKFTNSTNIFVNTHTNRPQSSNIMLPETTSSRTPTSLTSDQIAKLVNDIAVWFRSRCKINKVQRTEILSRVRMCILSLGKYAEHLTPIFDDGAQEVRFMVNQFVPGNEAFNNQLKVCTIKAVHVLAPGAQNRWKGTEEPPYKMRKPSVIHKFPSESRFLSDKFSSYNLSKSNKLATLNSQSVKRRNEPLKGDSLESVEVEVERNRGSKNNNKKRSPPSKKKKKKAKLTIATPFGTGTTVDESIL